MSCLKKFIKKIRFFEIGLVRRCGNWYFGNHLSKDAFNYVTGTIFCKKTDLVQIDIIPIQNEFIGVGAYSYSNKIFCPSSDGASLLIVDPLTDSYILKKIGLNEHLGYSGIQEYEGDLYIFPRSANKLIRYNPQEDEVYVVELNTSYTGEHHYCGIITSDGLLIQPPRECNHLLITDLNTYKTHKLVIGYGGKHGVGRYRYSSIIKHPNGYMYLIPDYNEKVIRLDPRTEKFEFIGTFFKDSRLLGPTIAPNGNIYGFLMFGGGILEIDVKTNKTRIICKDIETKSCGTECASNGKLYSIPGYSSFVYSFDLDNMTIKMEKELDIIFSDAYSAGGAMDSYGNIYAAPCHGKNVLKYCFNSDVRLSEAVLNFCENCY